MFQSRKASELSSCSTHLTRGMEVVAAGLSWALHNVSLQKVLGYIGLASLIKGPPWSKLSSRLSSEASIVLAGDPTFADLTSRWREWHSPGSSAVIRYFTEEDVQGTAGTPFCLAFSPADRLVSRFDMQTHMGYRLWQDPVATAPLKL
jgi:hypothetical protein